MGSMEDILFLFDIPAWIWSVVMKAVGLIAGTTPMEFSSVTWNYVVNDLMNWTLTIGSSLFVTFYLINMIRQTANLKQGITVERSIEIMISVMICNYAMVHGVELMRILFQIAGVWSKSIIITDGRMILQMDIDSGRFTVFLLLGLIYGIVSLVCSFTILYVVYKRYLELYVVVAVGPLAWSTIPGGSGISSTASAWLRGFLAKCFEIVIIAFFISVASKMCTAIDLLVFDDKSVVGWFDGGIQLIQNMLTMILVAGSAGGAEAFMRRYLGL